MIQNTKTKSDCEIQIDLDNLSKWSNKWCLTFNTSKWKRLHLGIDSPQFQHTMTPENNNMVLTEIVQEKDLDVWISNNFKCEKQVVTVYHQPMVGSSLFNRERLFTLTEKHTTLFIIRMLDYI